MCGVCKGGGRWEREKETRLSWDDYLPTCPGGEQQHSSTCCSSSDCSDCSDCSK